jgi:hypothetical protein
LAACGELILYPPIALPSSLLSQDIYREKSHSEFVGARCVEVVVKANAIIDLFVVSDAAVETE